METDEQTIDMFGEQLNSSMLSDTINIIENEKSARWPETMRELYDLFSCTVEKHGGSPELALVMLSELCRVYGGLQFYLPRGKTLQNTIRDLRVWQEFNGNNSFELAQKFDVTQREIWRITARMRSFETRRRQPDMFGDS
ncbi:MAG: Mor transcription activator family protein [Plesiomonas sp.]|uniref:Mor transcription activator family protein n=1 Tax=unclassified Plesiomonas TaxID=2647679 RepID=UPI00064647A0|nr:Mor transcription activator family protein [Plesiomonas sp. ZOR0011]